MGSQFSPKATTLDSIDTSNTQKMAPPLPRSPSPSPPVAPVTRAPSIHQINNQKLIAMQNSLKVQEEKIQHDLKRFYTIKRAITRICLNDEAFMDSPDIVKAQTTLEERPDLARKVHTAADALALLKAGNAAFLRSEGATTARGTAAKEDSIRKIALHFAQKPHAVIIACSDSRVPPEMIFSQGFGDLFVIRLAGNTVDALARASLLYAVLHLGAPLVVVMGHEACGAVTAALQPDEANEGAPGDIKKLVKNIQSGIGCHLLEAQADEERLLTGIICNVHHVVHGLEDHEDIKPLIQAGKLSIVGAYFAFNGVVSFFDEEEGELPADVPRGIVRPLSSSNLCLNCSGGNTPTAPDSPVLQGVNPDLEFAEELTNGGGKSI